MHYFYNMHQLDLFGEPIKSKPPSKGKPTEDVPEKSEEQVQPGNNKSTGDNAKGTIIANTLQVQSFGAKQSGTEPNTKPGLKQKAVDKETDLPTSLKKEKGGSPKDESVIFSDSKISVRLKSKEESKPIVPKEKKEKPVKIPQKRGRKSFKEINAEVDLIELPDDDLLFQKQYYTISEVSKWFKVNTSLIRFWSNEFSILNPKKNRRGDRLYRPEDVKNLQLIYQLLRVRKFSMDGAKDFIKTNKGKADTQLQLTQTLQKFKSFLLELKANL